MAEMKYYKVTFKDGEEWNCYTEDNREYKSHGIMWTSSLTKPSIPVLEPLDTMIEPLMWVEWKRLNRRNIGEE